jgi:hypothetical protein
MPIKYKDLDEHGQQNGNSLRHHVLTAGGEELPNGSALRFVDD